jgi:hypothetical protein
LRSEFTLRATHPPYAAAAAEHRTNALLSRPTSRLGGLSAILTGVEYGE